MSGWLLITAASPSRRSGWSSTLRIRICISLVTKSCLGRNSSRSLHSFHVKSVQPNRGPLPRLLRERNLCPERHLHFRSCARLAEYSQPAAETLCLLLHFSQASTAVQAFRSLRINPDTIIPHHDAESIGTIRYFDLDRLGTGVPVGVLQRLVTDAAHFALRFRAKPNRRAFYNHPKFHAGAAGQLLVYPRHRLFQFGFLFRVRKSTNEQVDLSRPHTVSLH